MTYFNNPLRNLAKSDDWQTVYCRAKELSCLQLFNNMTDLGYLQISFLQWLELYSSLEMDLALKEKNISKDVIDDDIRTDAYLLWKRLKKDEDKGKEKKRNKKIIDSDSSIPSVIFSARK